MVSLVVHGVLGVLTTAYVVHRNRRLFTGDWPGRRITPLEATYWVAGTVSLVIGWYCNVRYTTELGSHAGWVDFTQSLFTNWAASSISQDYIIVNVILFPIWSIVDGRRRGIRAPWMFFVMSLFTSFAFSMGAYLAFVERQVRYDRVAAVPPTVDAAGR